MFLIIALVTLSVIFYQFGKSSMNFFSERILNTRRSFIRDILEVAGKPEVISFAGGLPNPDLFPVAEIAEACQKVLATDSKGALQYAKTQGYHPLRSWIAGRYKQQYGMDVEADDILITNGSQQGIDLIGKVFLNEGDPVVVEKPGYLGALQALSMYQPEFHPVALTEEGINLDELKRTIKNASIKLIYSVPSFQNPTGITYSESVRRETAELLRENNILFVEDNPYGELRFMGSDIAPVKSFCMDNVLLLGSFSKVVVPSFRLGWVCARKEFIEKLIVAKQASDLHSSSFVQRVINQVLVDHNMDDHIDAIREVYKKQRDAMVNAIKAHFNGDIKCTKPEGGMFLWADLPDGMSSMKLFDAAVKKDVAFVPGFPFYCDDGGESTMRLNYSNADEASIDIGIKRLADAFYELKDN